MVLFAISLLSQMKIWFTNLLKVNETFNDSLNTNSIANVNFSSPILCLLPELHKQVLFYLPKEILCNLRLSCKHFKQLIDSSFLCVYLEISNLLSASTSDENRKLSIS